MPGSCGVATCRRRSAIMDVMTEDRHTSASSDDTFTTEDGLDRYVDAMTRVDPMHLASPAEALAELLSARLEHRSAPEARAVLESFISDSEEISVPDS